MGILKTMYLDQQNNDLTTLNFGIRMTSTKREYVEMTAKAKFEVWLGEWYRDRGKGVPYLTELLQGDPDFNIVESIFKAEALKITYVIDVVGYTYEFNNKTAEYLAEITLLIESENDGDGVQTVSVPISAGGDL